MGAASWYRTAKASHTKALQAPQGFLLTGDGEHTAGIFDAAERDPALLGPRLAEARYRDWQSNGGLFSDERQATAAPAELTLTAEERETKPNGTAIRDNRDKTAIAILMALVDEFGELFPEELAAAKQYLANSA
jgi:hypothetical protein